MAPRFQWAARINTYVGAFSGNLQRLDPPPVDLDHALMSCDVAQILVKRSSGGN